MASATKKANLKAARDCLAKKEFREALQLCKAVIKEDRNSFEAFL
jgi:hypothetical protein